MKKIRLNKADLISVLFCVSIVIPGISIYSKLPDRIVTNFDIYGQPYQYASKNFAVFGIPLIATVLQVIFCIITNLFHQTDKRDLINRAVRFILPAALYFAQGFILLYALGQLRNIFSVVCTIMAVLLVVLGNYMPKIRRNLFLGVRTPHTLRNQEVWDITHRFSGAFYFVCGIAMIPFSLVNNFIAALTILITSKIVPIIYSEIVYRSRKAIVTENGKARYRHGENQG